MKSPLLRLPLLLGLGLLASLASARAGLVTLTYSMIDLPTVTPASVGLLIVDTAGDGFMGISDPDGTLLSLTNYPLSPGAMLGDDLVLFNMGGMNIAPYTGFDSGVNLLDDTAPLWAGNLMAGDPLALVFFPTGSTAAGNPYGFYSGIDTPVFGSNQGYTVPPFAGGSFTILSATTNVTDGFNFGNVAPGSITTGTLGGAAVPEPGTFALSAFLALAASFPALRRNRKLAIQSPARS